MARRMLDIVLEGAFPEDRAAVAEAHAAAEAAAKLYTPQAAGRWRPAEGWQFVLNMYTASTKHASQENGWSSKGAASPRHGGEAPLSRSAPCPAHTHTRVSLPQPPLPGAAARAPAPQRPPCAPPQTAAAGGTRPRRTGGTETTP